MRPTVAHIDLHAIHANLRSVRKAVGKHPLIMAVVKANAYGHGAVPVAESIVKNSSAQYFGVAIVEEGIQLREAGIKLPIHVFTAPMVQQLPLFVQHGLEPTIVDLKTARSLNAVAKAKKSVVSVHVKVDTGMGRIGITPSETPAFMKAMKKFKHLFVKGVWTHFATSDEADLTFAHEQLKTFRSLITELELNGIHIPLVHCANSGAILQMPESYFDMVRPGIMMYGYRPSRETQQPYTLRPAMTLIGRVGFVKTVEKGTSISYGRRYIAKQRTTIASITVGYADGYFRTLTNKAEVIIRGKRCPIAGTVCMDQIMVDVGSMNVKPGDDVILLGKDKTTVIDAWEIAQWAGTIPYEVTCAVSARVPRNYNGQ